MLLKKNGYVLEQLLSPLVILTTPEHEELKALARDCITRHHSHHYLGFAETQWRLFSSEESPRIKPLLYTYRVLLTGIHLMRSGEIEANLLTLNEEFRLPFLHELIAQKLSGPEKASLNGAEISFHEVEVNRLRQELEAAHATSGLPELPSEETRSRLSKLLVRLRINPPVRGIQ
jgi:predicted nucleotidyltransferase